MIKKSQQQTAETRKNMRGGAGEVIIRHYFRPEEISARCRLCARLTLPVGAGIGLHEHSNEDEIFIIQQGKGIALDNNQEVEIEAGDAVLTGKGSSHAIRNTGNSDLIITAIIMQY
jgi:mannose-6-phosphate isomerase-like protein (cupin superfamily)